MPYTLYDYVDTRGSNVILDWLNSLQKKERIKVIQRIDMLAEHGQKLLPLILAASGVTGILKIKTHGAVQLRPLLCWGPSPGDKDTYTLLAGAKEVGSRWEPSKIRETAVIRKAKVTADPTNRRRSHAQPSK